jgi:hypothetical protein
MWEILTKNINFKKQKNEGYIKQRELALQII